MAAPENDASRDTQTVAPERRLTADDFAHHRYVVTQQQYASSVLDSWSKYLMQRYQLTPDQGITEDGRILTQEEAKAQSQ